MHRIQQSLVSGAGVGVGVEAAAAGIFPVLFFDGERETDIGTVVVSPSTTFKMFQSLISQKIGTSPHQITIYLERNHQINGVATTHLHHQQHYHRKIPVTNKFNFATIIGDKSCFFRAVLKRSRRARRRRPSKDEMMYHHNNGYNINLPENMNNFVLLRRGGSYPGLIPSPVQYDPVQYDPFLYDPVLYDPVFDNRMRILEEEKASYLMTVNMNSNVYSDLDLDWNSSEFGDDAASSGSGSRENNNRVVVCEFCESYEAKEGETMPFHFCQYDEVVTGVIVARAGPIARPTKPKSPEKDS